MGHELYNRPTPNEAIDNSLIESFRLSLAENQIRGTMETIFTNGAAVSHDGSKTYYNLDPNTIPHKYRPLYDEGRIVRCLPQELGIKSLPNESTSRLHIIPPNSHKKLAYSYHKKGSISIYLLHGLDNNGKPIEDYLSRNYDMDSLAKTAQRFVVARGLSPVVHSPKRIVTESLRELADRKPDGGLGEYTHAVRVMRDEQSIAVESVEKFLNGNHDK